VADCPPALDLAASEPLPFACLRCRWFKVLCEAEPQVVFSLAITALALVLPVTIVPMRRRMGMDTSQYDGLPAH